MVTIEKIEWSDESREEADVTISDGINSVTCFSSLSALQVKDVFLDKLYCLDVENLYKSVEFEPLIKKKDDFYEYFVRGKLEMGENKIVFVGELQIDILETSIPGDIFDGDMIEFTVSRLDIY